jgi:hypothetical protein
MCSRIGYNVPQIARIRWSTYNDAAGQRRAPAVFPGEQRTSVAVIGLQPGKGAVRPLLIVLEGSR